MRRTLLGFLGLSAVGAGAYAAYRAWSARTRAVTGPTEWDNAPFPFPPVPRPAPSLPTRTWVEPLDDGTCPAAYPVKAKLASGIYHLPGGLNYDRTNPDRCYADTGGAEQDGLRPSKT
jgi:hypothetical protein